VGCSCRKAGPTAQAVNWTIVDTKARTSQGAYQGRGLYNSTCGREGNLRLSGIRFGGGPANGRAFTQRRAAAEQMINDTGVPGPQVEQPNLWTVVLKRSTTRANTFSFGASITNAAGRVFRQLA